MKPELDEDGEELKEDDEGKQFQDELSGKPIPPIKSVLEIVDPNWIQVLVL